MRPYTFDDSLLRRAILLPTTLALLVVAPVTSWPQVDGRGKPTLMDAASVVPPGLAYRRWGDARPWLGLPGYGPAAALKSQTPEVVEVPLGTTTEEESLSQLGQSVAGLPSGGFVAVWVAGAWPSRDVWMQIVHRDGSVHFPGGGLAIAAAPTDEDGAVVAPHATSGFFVAFTRGLYVGGAGGRQVMVQYFDSSGQPQWQGDGVVVADQAVDSAQSNPHLVPDSSGGVFVCFEDFDWTADTDIRCQALDLAGHRLWSVHGEPAGGVPGWRVLPRGVEDGGGGLLVFWRNQRILGGEIDPMLMEGQHFAGDGARLWGARGLAVRTTGLAESNGHSYDFFDVAEDGSGGAVLAFDDWAGQQPRSLDVVAQRVSGAGQLLWGSDGMPIAASRADERHETTIGTGHGGIVVAVSKLIDSTHSEAWLFRVGPDGVHLWPTTGTLLSDPAATALDYGVLAAQQGGLVRFAWTHQVTPGTFAFDVREARYTLGGLSLDPPGGIALTAAPDAQVLHGFTTDSTPRHLAVWDDRRKGTWDDLDVYGAFSTEDLLFDDGFESGDTAEWSNVVP